jgi:hypothetical protein
MPRNREEDIKILRPDIERLICKVQDNPHAAITGYIFSDDPKLLIHFGNIYNRGQELKQIHYALSELAAGMQLGYINPKDVQFLDIGVPSAGAVTATENIADDLAKKILVTGLEPQYSSEITALAERYLLARK